MGKKLLFLMALVLTATMSLWADEATVYDGTSYNSYVPVYGLYCDDYQRSQTLYSADVLAEAGINAGSTITGLTYYLKAKPAAAWTSTWEVYLFETSETAMTTTCLSTDGLTPVVTGATFDATSGELAITFDNNYSYGGGNLVIDFRNLTDGNYKSSSFYGVTVTGGSNRGYNSASVANITNTTVQNFVPKTTFTFTAGAVSCPRPDAISVSNVTDNAADVAWVGTASSYELVVNGVSSIETGNSKALTGLTGNTKYDVKVRAICAAGDSSAFRGTNFKTLCGTITDEVWMESFEDHEKGSSTAAAPDCWEMIGANEGTYPYLYVNNSATYVSAGSKSLYNQSSATKISIAVLPVITNPQTKQISFKYRSESATNSPTICVGYVTDVTDSTTFHALSMEYPQSYGAFAEVEVPLNGIPAADAATARIAIRYNKSATNNYYTGIDEIVVETLPSCFRIQGGIEVASIGTNNAVISWLPSANRTETGYKVVIKNGADTIVNTTVQDTTVAVTGLTPATDYTLEVNITSTCGQDGDARVYTKSVTFTTECVTFVAPWIEDFNSLTSTSVLKCWDKSQGTAGETAWQMGQLSSKWLDGTKYYRFNSFSMSNGKWQALATPLTTIVPGTNFSYAWKNPTGGDMSILLTTDGGVTFDTLRTNMVSQTEWKLDTIDMAAYLGKDVSIVFLPVSNYGNGDAYVYLDNVAFNAPTYTATFVVNGDTTVQTLKYMQMPEYEGTPSKPATAQYTYNFTGWNLDLVPAVNNRVYVAKFDSVVNTYPIVFQKWDGTNLQVDTLAYGKTPFYVGQAPKTVTAQYTYTFKEWAPAIVKVTGAATYVAQCDSTVNTYVVTFKNANGNIIKKDTLEYGSTPACEDATQAPTLAQNFTFAGWTPAIAQVTENAVYTATYTASDRKYKVEFVNEGGAVLQSDSLVYKATPVYTGATPTKLATDEFDYVFSGWTPGIIAVQGDMVYTAQYASVIRKYDIVWKNADGSVLRTDKVAYGKTPKYNGKPAQAPTAQYTYNFTEWTPAIAAVSGNAVYTAQYEQVLRQYTVKAYVANGIVTINGVGDDFMEIANVAYGTEVTIEVTPAEGYVFLNWTDGNTDNPRKVTVNEDIILTAWMGLDATGIENINAEDGAVKFILDGKLYIKRGENIYDATGKLVK